MRVEVLHIDECPGWREAGTRVQRALDAVGLAEVAVEYRRIVTQADAAGLPFAGSPTILIDGEDAFFTDERTTSLACRLYPTESGIADLPTIAQIVQAIHIRR